MIGKLFKNPMFLSGFIFVTCILFVSIYYSVFIEPTDPHLNAKLRDANGNVIATAPFPPSEKYPLGTDRRGISMVHKLNEGAKYTIGFALIICFIRMVLSISLGVLFASCLKKLRPIVKSIVDSFTYAPAAIIVYVTLVSVVVVYSWAFSSSERLLFTFGAIILVAVPTVSIVISEEIEEISKREYIAISKRMGANWFHIFDRHIKPFLAPRFFIIFVQQMIQILLLFAHLGLLGLFVGGTDQQSQDANKILGLQSDLRTFSLSNEWGGLIAVGIDEAIAHPWMIYPPVIAMTVTIFAMILMVEGMKSVLLEQHPSVKHDKKTHQNKDKPTVVNNSSFEFVRKDQWKKM